MVGNDNSHKQAEDKTMQKDCFKIGSKTEILETPKRFEFKEGD